jgi:hypothetical protein
VHVLARTCASEAACPGCGLVSRRVHDHYQRKLADTASGGQEALIYLHARRFFRSNGACAKATFAEQVPGLIKPVWPAAPRGLQTVLQAVALALGGRAGARLTGRLACAVSRSTLLRLIRAAPDPGGQTPLVLGVDLSRCRDNSTTPSSVTLSLTMIFPMPVLLRWALSATTDADTATPETGRPAPNDGMCAQRDTPRQAWRYSYHHAALSVWLFASFGWTRGCVSFPGPGPVMAETAVL